MIARGKERLIQRMGQFLGAGALWLLSFAVACSLADYLYQIRWDRGGILDFLLSGSRHALSDTFYETADLYFHRGVPHKQPRAFMDAFQQLRLAVAPEQHRHSQGRDVEEIMPWLRFATLADPHNVEAYLVAAFWLADECGRLDLALDVIREGLSYNPRDYRLYAEAARIYMAQQDKDNAIRMLDTGIKLWPSDLDSSDQQVRLELARMLSYRGFLAELDGDRDRALSLFSRALRLFPENHALQERVQALRTGRINREWAEAAWRQIFPRRQVCSREHAEEHHDHAGESGRHHD